LAVAECDVCDRPLADGAYVCAACASRLAGRLRDAAGLVSDLDDAVARQTRMTEPGPRPRSHAPAAPIRPDGQQRHYGDQATGWPTGLLVDLAAAETRDAVTNTVTTWARVAAEESGEAPPGELAGLMRWLARRLDWVRHRQWAGECWDELHYAAGLVARAVDRPPARRWLGPCDVPGADGVPCAGDLYVQPGAAHVGCPVCGISHDVAERVRWLEQITRERAYTAAEIAAATGVRAERIRQWASRGQIAAHGRDRLGRPLYRLGEVLDLAAMMDRRRLVA